MHIIGVSGRCRKGASSSLLSRGAYELGRQYFQDEWSVGVQSHWYTRLGERWYQRSEAAPSAQRTSWLPSWALHPECAALAAIFASPYWADLAVPAPDRRHRRFCQHLLTMMPDAGSSLGAPEMCRFPGGGRHVGCHGTAFVPSHGSWRISLILANDLAKAN